MKQCNKCGTQADDNAKFCPSCGNNLDGGQQFHKEDFNQTLQKLNNTSDYTGQFEQADIEQNKILALFAYLGILFIIPLLAAPNSKYARFHANQGLVLFIAEILVSIVSGILSSILWFLGGLVGTLIGLVMAVLVIIGIINAVTGKAKELPFIGGIKIIR